MEFPTAKELSEHIKSGHKTRPKGWKPRQKRITLEEAERHSQSPKVKKQAFSKKEVASKKPIELQYLFVGQCPDCSKEVETITVNVGAKDAMIAYCSSCKRQYKEIKVIPIDKQS